MKYMYFTGVASGTSKKTEKPWWSINVLRTNRWGSIEIKPLYCATQKDWEELCAICPAVGAPVDIKTDLDGNIVDITEVKDIPALDLR